MENAKLTTLYSGTIVAGVSVARIVAASAALMLALLFFAPSAQLVSAAPPACGLLQDCYFDDFYGNEGAGSGAWKIFGNTSSIGLNRSESWPAPPSVQIHSDHAGFDGGIYQRVAATPGTGYKFVVYWAVVMVDGKGMHESEINRRLGIDPFGGTDPNSGNIRWSPDYFGSGKFELEFQEYARSPFITVFVRVQNPYGDKVVDVFLDTATLDPEPGMPAIQVEAPSATPPPPTQTPPPPTSPPTRVAQAQPTDVPTDEPEPTDEPTIEPTATDEPTLEPSDEPQPTRTRIARVAPTTRPTRVRAVSSAPASASPNTGVSISPSQLGLLGVLGVGGVLGAGVLIGLAVILLRRK